MGPEGTGLYGWTPARHTARLDSDAAHRRADRLRRRGRLASEAHRGLVSRLGAWLGQTGPAPAYR